jgi:ATP:cob(I)alamin adenosyltransferase
MADKVHRIYTRFGDQGQTKLLSGETIAKDALRVDTYGTLDELQSHLGMARALVGQEILKSMICAVQKDLFVAGAELASSQTALPQRKRRITKQDVSALEDKIDRLTESFGLSRSFVIPGTSPDSAALHVSRSACRRLERLIVRLNRETNSYQDLIVYFNRLGDLLFAMAWSATVSAVIENVLDGLVSGEKQAQRHTVCQFHIQ